MQNKVGSTVVAVIALQIIAGIGAVAAHADSRQDNKNFWRNATIASGAVGVYGLTHHKDTLTIAGAAGALYSGQRYEDDRRSQSRQSHHGGGNWYYQNHARRGDDDGGGWHHDHGHHYGWYKHHHHHHHHDEDHDGD